MIEMTTSEQRARTLWLCVTPDQYELPMIVADSAKELARKAGVTAETVFSAVYRAEKYGTRSQYIRIVYPSQEDSIRRG